MIITSTSKHPLCEAFWVWPGGHMYIYNQYAAFRKDFNLNSVNKSIIYITADQIYRLYVNGQYVCRGPARGYQSHWPFDEIDITELLKKGHNWISVLAYNQGVSTFHYRHQSAVGFLCALQSGEELIVSDKSWKMIRVPGIKKITGRYSVQMAFQEHVDKTRFSSDWITKKDFNDKWEDPETDKIMHDDIYRFGRAPYDTCEERGIPMLEEKVIVPGKIASKAEGACGSGYKSWDNVSWGWVEEAYGCKNWDCSYKLDEKSGKDGLIINVPPAGTDKYKSVTIDAGEYLVGTIIVDVENATGDEIIDFQHHENIVNGRPEIRKAGSACQIGLANRLFASKGSFSHEFYHPLGYHYFTVIVRNSLKPLKLNLRIRTAYYPFTMKGSFNCSDETLNQIFSICRHTQKICSLDAYVDTPWREQAQWWGDARVQARNTFYIDGDARLFKRGIRSIAGQSTLQGLTFGHAPTTAYNCILQDFSLTWIITIWDYYWQTKDISLFSEQLDRIYAVLGYFDSAETRSAETGLLKHDRRFWFFGDWSTLFKGEIPTFLNLWYLYALRTLVNLFEVAGMTKEKKAFEQKASAHQKLVMKYLYDNKTGDFFGGLNEKLKPSSDEKSVHDHVLAIMTGILPDMNEQFIKKWILPYLKEEKLNGALPSAFWATYLFEEAGNHGCAVEVIDFIRKKWSPMLQTGTTWEIYEWDENVIFSASHAWTAHPCYHLTNILTGVRQTGAAWSNIEFRPPEIQEIESSSSEIPSPNGLIKASWEKSGSSLKASLELPKNVRAEVYLNGKKTVCTGPCRKSIG